MRFARSTSSCGGQQPHLPDVLQEELQRVGRHVRPQVDLALRLAPALAGVGRFDLWLGLTSLKVFDQLYLGLLEEPVELLDIGLVQVNLRDCVGDFVIREDALLLTLGYETLDLI